MTDAQPSIDEADWNDTDAPAEGQLVQVRAQDGHGFYVLPSPSNLETTDGSIRKQVRNWIVLSPRGGL